MTSTSIANSIACGEYKKQFQANLDAVSAERETLPRKFDNAIK